MITFRQFESGEGLEGLLLVLLAIINKDVFLPCVTKHLFILLLLGWKKATHFITKFCGRYFTIDIIFLERTTQSNQITCRKNIM